MDTIDSISQTLIVLLAIHDELLYTASMKKKLFKRRIQTLQLPVTSKRGG